MNPIQAAFLITAVAATAIAGILIRLGLRGRCQGDHPHCKKCGFDLFGKPPDSPSCPECGSLINGPKQIHMGVHRHRRPPLVVGCCFVLLALASLDEVYRTSSVPWIQHVPARLLFYALKNADPAHATTAEAELIRRYDAGQLDHALLMNQLAFLPVPWPPEKMPTNFDGGDALIEDAGMHGDIEQSSWTAFCKSLCTYEITTRQHIRRGAPIPILISGMVHGDRTCHLSTTVLKLDIDGIPLDAADLDTAIANIPNWAIQGSGAAETQIELPDRILSRISNGVHSLQVTGQLHTEVGDWHASVPCSFTGNASTTFVLEPADYRAVKLKIEPSLRAAMAQAFARSEVSVYSNGDVSVWCSDDNLPIPAGGRVFLRSGGHEWKFDPPKQFPRWNHLPHWDDWDSFATLPDFRASTVDIIVRPDPASVEKFVAPDEIWGEDIIVPNVTVQHLK